MENTKELQDVLAKYAVPDPKIVGKLPKGGTQLDFVGHADITRILIEIDPHWRLVPIAWENGRPAMNIIGDMATMWFELTLLGTPRLAIGSAKANTPDLDKVLYGDALRNGAMRFGISLSLWTKQEWEDLNTHPAPARPAQAKPQNKAVETLERVAAKAAERSAPGNLTEEQRSQFITACEKAQLDPSVVAKNAGLDWSKPILESSLSDLRESFKELKSFKEGA
jgi:hypothetical protein